MAEEKCPKLVVFDLDKTLWPFWIDTHIDPPIKMNHGDGEIYDKSGFHVRPFPEAEEVLRYLTENDILVGVASRTESPRLAEQLIELLDWNQYFTYKEIYPGRKTAHFAEFKKCTDFDYRDMLFFDDEQRNIIDIKALGVMTILVDSNGMTMKLLIDSLRKFAARM